MTEGDIFDGCRSTDEVLALVYDQAGSEGLKELLAHLSEAGFNRQSLLSAARRLEIAGLTEAGATVAEMAGAADEHVSRDVLEVLEDNDTARMKTRLASLYRNGRLSAADVALLAENEETAGMLPYITDSVRQRRLVR
jgi:hypothetical protein